MSIANHKASNEGHCSPRVIAMKLSSLLAKPSNAVGKNRIKL
jgi:hypothetical protein